MTMLNRPRRMRESSFSRTLMRENNISVSNLIYPMFVIEGTGVRQDIESMPGIQRLSIDELIKDASECSSIRHSSHCYLSLHRQKIKNG